MTVTRRAWYAEMVRAARGFQVSNAAVLVACGERTMYLGGHGMLEEK